MSQNGKGSKQRPRQVPRAQFDASWDKVFGGPKDRHSWGRRPKRPRAMPEVESGVKQGSQERLEQMGQRRVQRAVSRPATPKEST